MLLAWLLGLLWCLFGMGNSMAKKKHKNISQRMHAKMRAKERFDLDLVTQDLTNMILMIYNNQAKLVEHQSKRISVHDLEYNGVNMRVVYDSFRKEIVTFLYQVTRLDSGERGE